MLFKLYMSKLHPEISSLWQKPRDGDVNYADPVWYERRNVGKDMLDRFMKISLCKSITLDGNYTNHSIRATVITELDEAGFEGRHIIQLSSHKNEATIKQYSKKCPENKCKEMFDSLSSALQNKCSKPTSTVTIASNTNNNNNLQVADAKENLPNFNLQPIDEFETIDDEAFTSIILDAEKLTNTTNQDKTTNNAVDTVAPIQNIQNTVNTINNNNIGHKPFMYFPNSNVTINYNIKNYKKGK